MSKKILLAQSVEELKFILSNIKKMDTVCVPLNLSTQLYCIINKINFYNPINYITNDFHREVLLESENLINKIDAKELNFESHIKEYKALIRFKFYSAVFLIELIEKINHREKIGEIYVSGWNRYIDQYSSDNYFVSNLVYDLIDDVKVTKITKSESDGISSRDERKYEIKNKRLDKKKNYILMNNIGYNFKRIVFFFIKKKFFYNISIF